MLLSYTEICELIEQGVIENADYANVNSSSLDIRVGNTFLVEAKLFYEGVDKKTLVLNKKESPGLIEVSINDGERILLASGQFMLAHSIERFNLPNNISAEYKLKSTMARMGLEHLNAGWCDAGWTNSTLTLELKNMLNHHEIIISPGDKIGQLVFFKHTPVPVDKSYAVRGSYNNQVVPTVAGATAGKD